MVKIKKNAHNLKLLATAYVSTDYHLSTNVKESDCVSYILIKDTCDLELNDLNKFQELPPGAADCFSRLYSQYYSAMK